MKLWSNCHFLMGDFFLLRIPWYGKLIGHIQSEKFCNYSFKIIECLYRKSAWQLIFDNSLIGVEHTNQNVFLCLYTFWRLLDRIQAKIKSGSFLTKKNRVVVRTNENNHFFWRRPVDHYYPLSLSISRSIYSSRI